MHSVVPLVASVRRALTLVLVAGASLVAPRAALAQITITSSNNYTVNWNGNQFWNSTVPTNLASAAGTANAFGSRQFNSNIHAIVNINDGLYGNSESWIAGGSGTANSIGVRFTQASDVTSVSLSRDNSLDGLYSYTDTVPARVVGSYMVQFTTVASPGTATPAGDWTTAGTISMGSASGSFAA